jgi:hypothetical protein
MARRITSSSAPGSSEEMRGAGNDFEPHLARHLTHRLVVQRKHRKVIAADNQQRWRLDAEQPTASQVGTATARHDGSRHLWTLRGRDQRSGRSSTGAKIGDRKGLQVGLQDRPVYGRHHAASEPRDVEPELERPHVDRLFFASQQIEQQGRVARAVQRLGHLPVARTVSAASAAVREDHKPLRLRRYPQIGIEPIGAVGDVHAPHLSPFVTLRSSTSPAAPPLHAPLARTVSAPRPVDMTHEVELPRRAGAAGSDLAP